MRKRSRHRAPPPPHSLVLSDVHFVLLLPARVLLQDDEPLQHVREGDVLLRREFRALCRAQPHWGGVRLEARDRSWLAGLADDVDSLETQVSASIQ